MQRVALVGAAAFLVGLQAIAAAAGQAAATPTPKTCSEAEAWKLGWPMIHGPDGNFNPLRIGAPLVSDLKDARKIWESEYRDIGVGKCGDRPRGVVKSLNDPLMHQGGFGSPILADGTIFVAHYRPSGSVLFPHEGEAAAFPAGACTVAADDVVAAMDARTGKTRWVAVQKDKGVNIQMGKRGGWGVTPAYLDGRVFAVGTTGRLYALDAATGRTVWESDVGKAHAAMEAAKKEALAEKKIVAGKIAWNASLMVAGGVLVVPVYGGHDLALRGLAPADGKVLWEVPAASAGTATPALVRLEGREYVLAATNAGMMRLIEPATGKVLWTVEGLGANRRTLTPDGGYVIVNTTARQKPEYGRLGCFRLTTGGADKVWEMPDRPEFGDAYWPDGGAHRHGLLRDGLAYMVFGAKRPRGQSTVEADAGYAVVRLATGEILFHRQIDRMGMPYLVEDRLLYFGDLCHHPAWGKWWLISADPSAAPVLPQEGAAFDHLLTSGYEVQLEFPIVAGRIFMRTLQGRIACYDLRAR